jgi:hypothetical protein
MTHTETLRLALEALETSMYPQQKQLQAITAIKAALEAKDEPVQVSPLEFVAMVMEKEHLIGKPIVWAEWPNKEQNT